MTALLALPVQRAPSSTALARTAAAASAVAAGVHLAAFPGHRSEGAAGAFFLTVAIVQFVAAMTILRGARPATRAAMIAGNIALVGLWAWSRTAGVPIGPHPGSPEAVGVLDVTAVVAQAVAVVALVLVPRRRASASSTRPRLALAGLALVVGAGGAALLPGAHRAQDHGPVRHAHTPGSESTDGASTDEPVRRHDDDHDH